LLKTEWNGLSRIENNPETGQRVTPEARQFIAKYIGTTPIAWSDGRTPSKLIDEVSRMSEDPRWMEEVYIQKQKEQAIGLDPKLTKVKQAPVYKQLDKLHAEAKRQAWAEWRMKHVGDIGVIGMRKAQERYAALGEAGSSAQMGKEYEDVLKLLKF